MTYKLINVIKGTAPETEPEPRSLLHPALQKALAEVEDEAEPVSKIVSFNWNVVWSLEKDGRRR